VAFREKTDAEQAINTMNGEFLGTRAIRVNWANQKGGMSSSVERGPQPAPAYEVVVAQAPQYNSTVYVGNLTPYTTQDQLVSLFQQFGYIIEVRMQVERGFAFVKMDTHENAAMAIVQLQGKTTLNGRYIKCAWGKDRTHDQNSVFQTIQAGYGYPAGFPGYGMAQQQYPAVAPPTSGPGAQQWSGYASYDPYSYYGGYAGAGGMVGGAGQQQQVPSPGAPMASQQQQGFQ